MTADPGMGREGPPVAMYQVQVCVQDSIVWTCFCHARMEFPNAKDLRVKYGNEQRSWCSCHQFKMCWMCWPQFSQISGPVESQKTGRVEPSWGKAEQSHSGGELCAVYAAAIDAYSCPKASVCQVKRIVSILSTDFYWFPLISIDFYWFLISVELKSLCFLCAINLAMNLAFECFWMKSIAHLCHLDVEMERANDWSALFKLCQTMSISIQAVLVADIMPGMLPWWSESSFSHSSYRPLKMKNIANFVSSTCLSSAMWMSLSVCFSCGCDEMGRSTECQVVSGV